MRRFYATIYPRGVNEDNSNVSFTATVWARDFWDAKARLEAQYGGEDRVGPIREGTPGW